MNLKKKKKKKKKDLEQLLRKTMENAAVETSGNATDDNNGIDQVQTKKTH